MGKKKTRAKKTSSGLSKVYRKARQEKLPQIIEGKKRRLITRLKQYNDSGTYQEDVKTLRKRLHGYIVNKSAKKLSNKEQAEREIINQLGWNYANYKTELYNSRRESRKSSRDNRDSSEKLLSIKKK